jgi:hypothetical protein
MLIQFFGQGTRRKDHASSLPAVPVSRSSTSHRSACSVGRSRYRHSHVRQHGQHLLRFFADHQRRDASSLELTSVLLTHVGTVVADLELPVSLPFQPARYRFSRCRRHSYSQSRIQQLETLQRIDLHPQSEWHLPGQRPNFRFFLEPPALLQVRHDRHPLPGHSAHSTKGQQPPRHRQVNAKPDHAQIRFRPSPRLQGWHRPQ